MVHKKFQAFAQIVGTVTIGLLAVYGLLAVLNGGTPVWAIGRGEAAAPAQAGAPQAVVTSSVPAVMNYQGYLRDDEGNLMSGYYTMTFSIYASAVDPSPLWTETLVNVTVRDGYFNVLLGDAEPFPAGLFGDPDRYVGVALAPYAEMVPRQRFASVPYAVQADYALTATVAVTAIDALHAGEADEAANADTLDGYHANTLAPPGTVVAYAGSTETVPLGWLICDGSAISRTQYADLFAAIGTAHGEGDGSTTFNLPDYRGYFLRGVDAGAGRDPDADVRTAPNPGGNSGDAVGSVQDDAFEQHTHSLEKYAGIAQNVIGSGGSTHVWENVASGSTGNQGGSETRPINAYVIWIIRY